MEIKTKEDVSLAIAALEKCAKEHKEDTKYTGKIIVSDLCTDVANFLKKHYCDLEQHMFMNSSD